MLIYGINAVMEALHSERVEVRRVLIQEGKDNPRVQAVRRYAERFGVPIETGRDLKRVVRSPDHQGVGAEVPQLGETPLTDATLADSRVVLFDSLRDPHNFGAALRVCDCFDFRTIVYFKGNSSGVSPAAVKVSAGAAFHVDIYECNLNKAVKRLAEAGFSICALEAEGDCTIYDMPIPDKLCLVIGSEGEGVRHNIRRTADHLVSIPMAGRVNSLNVSCALTAALTEFARRSWAAKEGA